MRKLLLFPLFALFGFIPGFAQDIIHPDSTRQAWKELERRREVAKAKAQAGGSPVDLIRLGVWGEEFDSLSRNSTFVDSLEAYIWRSFLQADFRQAKGKVLLYGNIPNKKYLSDLIADGGEPLDIEVFYRYRILLAIEEWDIPAAKQYISLADTTSLDPVWVSYQSGRIDLWDKKYDEVQQLADSLISVNPGESLPWLLKAEAAFWLLDLETAEQALIECLTLDPFNADARFWYGYAIWRKRDAQLLDDMAAQWELALAINPYHYLTHWHWGNGHTHLTYADYFDSEEDQIRKSLTQVDANVGLVGFGSSTGVFSLIDSLIDTYSESIIPSLYMGSFYYQVPLRGFFGKSHRIEYWPKAIEEFLHILQEKPHYGPAHNGLAACIKQKQIEFLADYDSLESIISNTEISQPETFYSVFPDVKRYPGDRVANMVYSQLHTGVAYLDMLDSLDRTFAIPPLHEDLSIAMNNPWFRGATTFDNRQWMDIRGVGSGATGIEYVERGSHLERNVTLHEYVHLFHGTVLTDQERRRIRELYEQAMANDFTLDYYARNNEFEYFAQGFPAYFSEKKVHPLNHKSVNTRSDLLAKDPDLYGFIDSLVQRQRAYLEGDASALASNWAQTFLRLTDQALINNDQEAAAGYVNQAYKADSTYLPVYFAQVKLAALRSYWAEAERWFDRAEEQFPGSSEVARAKGNYVITLYETGLINAQKASAGYLELMRQAIAAETDDLLVAEWQAELRRTMFRFAQWDVIVTETESYLATGDTTSTYLRDLQDDAKADVAWIRGMLGYKEEAKTVFDELLNRKPQNLRYRIQFAEVLDALEEGSAVIEVVADMRDLYIASGNPQAKLEYLLAKNMKTDSLARITLDQERIPQVYQEKWAMIPVLMQDSSKANSWISQLPERRYPDKQAERKLLDAVSARIADDWEGYEENLEAAIKLNPFHLQARTMLIKYLLKNDRETKAERLILEGQLLPIYPGPDAPEWARYEFSDIGEEE